MTRRLAFSILCILAATACLKLKMERIDNVQRVILDSSYRVTLLAKKSETEHVVLACGVSPNNLRIFTDVPTSQPIWVWVESPNVLNNVCGKLDIHVHSIEEVEG